MTTEPTEPFDARRICLRAGHCPICAQPNDCRLETGAAYKGPCWCERPALSGAALRRLQSELPEQRCLCESCLGGIASDPEISWESLLSRSQESRAQPPAKQGDFYLEGALVIFTEQFHLRRGSCCGSGCRHCPYGPTKP